MVEDELTKAKRAAMEEIKDGNLRRAVSLARMLMGRPDRLLPQVAVARAAEETGMAIEDVAREVGRIGAAVAKVRREQKRRAGEQGERSGY